MIACREWNDRLLDAALLGSVSGKLERHLHACGPCTKKLADLRSKCERMDHAICGLVGEAEAPPELQLQIPQAIAALPVKRQWWPEVAAIAAMALVFCTVLLLIPLRRNGAAGMGGQRRAISDSSLTVWQSPTASLLRSANNQLLQSPPRLGDFYFSLTTTNPNSVPSQKTHRRKP